jgi:hypothetical protein
MKTCVIFCHTLERNSLDTRICQGGVCFYKKSQMKMTSAFCLGHLFRNYFCFGDNQTTDSQHCYPMPTFCKTYIDFRCSHNRLKFPFVEYEVLTSIPCGHRTALEVCNVAPNAIKRDGQSNVTLAPTERSICFLCFDVKDRLGWLVYAEHNM